MGQEVAFFFFLPSHMVVLLFSWKLPIKSTFSSQMLSIHKFSFSSQWCRFLWNHSQYSLLHTSFSCKNTLFLLTVHGCFARLNAWWAHACRRLEEAAWSLGIKMCCELPCWCWEQNLNPLEKQPVSALDHWALCWSPHLHVINISIEDKDGEKATPINHSQLSFWLWKFHIILPNSFSYSLTLLAMCCSKLRNTLFFLLSEFVWSLLCHDSTDPYLLGTTPPYFWTYWHLTVYTCYLWCWVSHSSTVFPRSVILHSLLTSPLSFTFVTSLLSLSVNFLLISPQPIQLPMATWFRWASSHSLTFPSDLELPWWGWASLLRKAVLTEP